MARRALSDLLAATEAVGDDEPVLRSLADGRKEFEFADGDGDVEFFRFETKRASHPAASGSRALKVDAEAAHDGHFGGHRPVGCLAEVSVKWRFTIHVGVGRR